MSGFKTFAVAGAGGIGRFVVQELLKLKEAGKVESVTILSRSATGDAELLSQGATLATVNYDDTASLTSAITGIDVVISTINGFGSALNSQDKLADACKAAGVKLFVPSEFGGSGDLDGHSLNPHLAPKEALRKKLKDIDLPYVVFYNGFFSDRFFSPDLTKISGLDFANGKATVNGVGDALISFTSRQDIAVYTAYVLTSLPRESLEWRAFRIQGDAMSFNQIIKTVESETGKTIDVTYKPRSALEEAYAKNPNDLLSFLFLQMDTGKGIVGSSDQLDNKKFPEWKPTKVIDLLKAFLT